VVPGRGVDPYVPGVADRRAVAGRPHTGGLFFPAPAPPQVVGQPASGGAGGAGGGEEYSGGGAGGGRDHHAVSAGAGNVDDIDRGDDAGFSGEVLARTVDRVAGAGAEVDQLAAGEEGARSAITVLK